MIEELKGDYECDECGYTTHNPINKICHNCGGELVYIMTWQDEIEVLTKERDKLKIENDWYKEKNLEWQKKYDADTDQLHAENKRLRNILSHLFEACMRADIEGDLSELISGEILDAAQQALNEVEK